MIADLEFWHANWRLARLAQLAKRLNQLKVVGNAKASYIIGRLIEVDI